MNNGVFFTLSSLFQAVGASSLSSQVYEHDDVPALLNGDLNLDTFMSPNIQMFILNNTTLLSLVEIPGNTIIDSDLV